MTLPLVMGLSTLGSKLLKQGDWFKMRYISWIVKVIMNIWTCVLVYDWQVHQNVNRTYYLLIISRISQVYSDLDFMAACLITAEWIDKDLKTTSLSL
jgi:hypothetical protein